MIWRWDITGITATTILLVYLYCHCFFVLSCWRCCCCYIQSFLVDFYCLYILRNVPLLHSISFTFWGFVLTNYISLAILKAFFLPFIILYRLKHLPNYYTEKISVWEITEFDKLAKFNKHDFWIRQDCQICQGQLPCMDAGKILPLNICALVTWTTHQLHGTYIFLKKEGKWKHLLYGFKIYCQNLILLQIEYYQKNV